MPKTNAEKQRDLKARRIKLGLVRREYWASKRHHQAIKKYLAGLKALDKVK